jgi:hypothetical protein
MAAYSGDRHTRLTDFDTPFLGTSEGSLRYSQANPLTRHKRPSIYWIHDENTVKSCLLEHRSPFV